MASSTVLRANTSPLKRTFDFITLSAEPILSGDSVGQHRHYASRRSLSLSSTLASTPTARHYKRRTLSVPSSNSMLVQTTPIMSGTFPSFMSVYGNEDTNLYSHALAEHDTKVEQLGFSHFPANTTQSSLDSQPRLIERRSSLTSTASYSTESSPTTTGSTFDSPLMADQSPDYSPESASSAAPPNSFRQPKMRSAGTQTEEIPYETQTILPVRPSPQLQQVVEEPKKNLKKLTLDMKLPSLSRPAISSDPASQTFSAPTSPLREPLKTGRRKPNNLSIRTPGFNQLSFGANSLVIPPTPAQKPVLHQVHSPPAVSELTSPTLGPIGGMRLTLPNIAQNLAKDSHFNGMNSIQTTNLPILREEPYQPPQSQETPEKGYTNGPCLIYDTGVYLYLEPTAEEASKFDTVINVAKEIKNPFETPADEHDTVVSTWRNNAVRQSIVEPQTAMSEISFKSAFEWPSSSGPATPTTPKPLSSSQIKRPEYLHVKWDHNSEILDDLLPLCRLIDDRVKDGKRVLIHCQLGVSRSASLIIAYGLYKGYESDFHSMYMAVKKRSQWVGPNMSLIYQLTDFKSKCDKGAYVDCNRQPKPEWFVYDAEGMTTPTAEPHPKTQGKTTPQVEHVTSSRPVLRLDKELPPVPSLAPKERMPIQSIVSTLPVSTQIATRLSLGTNGQVKPIKKATPRALPFREMGYGNQPMAIPPHRPRVNPGLTFAQPSMDLAMQDVPAVPSLFSPRATEFSATPFGITTAGDLVTSTPKAVKPPPGAFPGGTEWRNSLLFGQDMQAAVAAVIPSKPLAYDPRSPHQISETREIFRSIDGVL